MSEQPKAGGILGGMTASERADQFLAVADAIQDSMAVMGASHTLVRAALAACKELISLADEAGVDGAIPSEKAVKIAKSLVDATDSFLEAATRRQREARGAK